MSRARASASSGSCRPSMLSARARSFSSAASSSGLNTRTRARERSAALSSKDGFSVVAPTSVTVPSSITGRKESCCARLKRWISSTKRSVPVPVSRRARAASKTFLRSATPEKTAEICSKWSDVARASSRATVVLPVPGGPQKTSEPSVPVASIRVSAPSGPRRWSCPTTSASFSGRSRSASGRGAVFSSPAALNSDAMARRPLAAAEFAPDKTAIALDGQLPEPRAGRGGSGEPFRRIDAGRRSPRR